MVKLVNNVPTIQAQDGQDDDVIRIVGDGEEASAVQATNAEKPKVPSKVLRYSLTAIGLAALGTEAAYEMFTYEQNGKSLGMIAKVFGYSAMTASVATTIQVANVILTAGDAGSNVTFFSPFKEGNEWATQIAKGAIPKYFSQLAKPENAYFPSITSAPVNVIATFVIPVAAMGLQFAIGGYADVEPLDATFKNTFGNLYFIPEALLVSFAVSYYGLGVAGDILNGAKYLTQGSTLVPPQSTLLYKIFREGQLSLGLQCLIEQYSATINRATSFGYIAGLFAQQQFGDGALTTAQAIGFGTGIVWHLGRSGATYNKYFGDKERRLDLVTEDERYEAKKEYSKKSIYRKTFDTAMTYVQPLGLSTLFLSSGSGYMAGKAIYNSIESNMANDPANPNETMVVLKDLLPYALATLSMVIFYLNIYAKAQNTTRLNNLAVDLKIKREVAAASLENGKAPDEKAGSSMLSSLVLPVAFLFAFGTSTSRILAGTVSYMENEFVKSVSDNQAVILMFAAAINILVQMNGFSYTVQKNAKVLGGYGDSLSNFVSEKVCPRLRQFGCFGGNQDAAISRNVSAESLDTMGGRSDGSVGSFSDGDDSQPNMIPTERTGLLSGSPSKTYG